MISIVIAACTYKRPAGLRTLLAALDKLRPKNVGKNQIAIVIVDNSEDLGAQAAVAEYAGTGQFAVHYVSERRKGIAHARNAVLAKARSLAATHLAFIDDDEVPEPDWLDQLLTALQGSGAAAAVGPVLPVFESVPARYVPIQSYLIERPHREGLATEGHTCNCLMDLSAIAASNLTFDTRFNEMGGEDTDFFDRMRRSGHVIAWAQSAIVHEYVPRARMRPQWLLRRWYRTGSTEAAMKSRTMGPASSRVVNLGMGLVRIAAGSAKVLAAVVFQSWRQPAMLTASCYTLCRGCGFVAYSLGYNYREYSHPTYR